MSKKVIGILGGMGPLATADLFQKITLHTVAACDQAHPRVCIDSNTDIADRTAALLHGGEDPVPEMIKSMGTGIGIWRNSVSSAVQLFPHYL